MVAASKSSPLLPDGIGCDSLKSELFSSVGAVGIEPSTELRLDGVGLDVRSEKPVLGSNPSSGMC